MAGQLVNSARSMTQPDAQRAEIGHFLQTRRAMITPQDVGLPDAGRRRTPGLRREEVSLLAGMSVSWYTWLEQGRKVNLTQETLAKVGRSLRLSDLERAYLFRLAGFLPDTPAIEAEQANLERLRTLADGWWPSPAYVTDRCWNVIAVNRIGRGVLAMSPDGQNILEDIFLVPDPGVRFPQGYRGSRRRLVARFRSELAGYGADEKICTLVDRLRAGSKEFDQLWNLHEVEEPDLDADMTYVSGDTSLIFQSNSLRIGPSPDAWLTVLIPADDRTRDELARRYGPEIG